MSSLLLRGGSCHKEMRIEALGHAFRSNPVGKVTQVIGCQHEVFGMCHLYQRTLAPVKSLAIGIEARNILIIKRQYHLDAICKQDARFLE